MEENATVSVIGLGAMGSTLARLLLRGGYEVTVWNRTREKADPLVAEGAVVPSRAAAAVTASDVLVVCVYDYKAANEILATKEVESVLAGRVIVQLTTGSPQEARDSERWARGHGADYIDGAIQAAPSQMARPDTTILVSGAESAYRQSEALLRIFGGNVKYLGEAVGAASTMDLATLSYVYGATLGFFHGARVAESEGFGVDQYGGIVAEISPSFGEFFRHEGAVIQSGDYRISESPLRISVEATERLAQAARDGGLNAEFPELVSRLFKRALAAGYGDQEVAALIKVLRAGPGERLEHLSGEREDLISKGSRQRGGRAMKPNVSIIGAGRMGSALVRAFLTHGCVTNVWNRTRTKSAPLAALGAQIAETVRDAVVAADIVVVNVSDYATSRRLLQSADVAEELRGKLLVQLTSGSPRQARELAMWAQRHNIQYLDGAIMATPNLVGGPECTILYAGSADLFEQHTPTLRALGENALHVGSDVGHAAALDSALLVVLWSALFGAIHGAAICQAEEISLDAYMRYLEPVLAQLSGWVLEDVKRIHDGRLLGDESTLATVEAHYGAFRCLMELCRERGISQVVPNAFDRLFQAAIKAGHAQDEFVVLSKFVRAGRESTTENLEKPAVT